MGGYRAVASSCRLGGSPTTGVTMVRPAVTLAPSEIRAAYGVYRSPECHSRPSMAARHLHREMTLFAGTTDVMTRVQHTRNCRLSDMEETTRPRAVLINVAIRNRPRQATAAVSPGAARSAGQTR